MVWRINRIIAIGVNDPEEYRQANLLAVGSELKGRKAITSSQYLRGLVYDRAGRWVDATQRGDAGNVPINSCIAFMNLSDRQVERVCRSITKRSQFAIGFKTGCVTMATARVRNRIPWSILTLPSNVNGIREKAKERLAEASEESPYGIINAGDIRRGYGFSVVERRCIASTSAEKVSIDVIQAVGRAMRTAPEKDLRDYIICPILIPPNADPEKWTQRPARWKRVGRNSDRFLMALRAHDQRIEAELSDLLTLYLPRRTRSHDNDVLR